ncbi:MAG: hypothetical protein ACO3L1_05825, partial [Flavobacteriaceae bacterium]
MGLSAKALDPEREILLPKSPPAALRAAVCFFFSACAEQAQQAEKKKPSHLLVQGLFGSGERGIRTPGGVTLNGFQ